MDFLLFFLYFILLIISIKVIHKYIRGFKYATIIRVLLFFLPFLIPSLQYGFPSIKINDTNQMALSIFVTAIISVIVLCFHLREIKPYFIRDIYFLMPHMNTKTFFITQYALIGSVFFEEIFYRYYLPKENIMWYVVFSSVLFTLAHFFQDSTRKDFSLKSYVSILFLSVVWCYATIFSKSIIPAIIGHLIYNSPKIIANIYHFYFSIKNKEELDFTLEE